MNLPNDLKVLKHYKKENITKYCTQFQNKDSRVTALSLHPGLVRTELMRHADLGGKADIALGFLAKIFFPVWYIVSKSAKEGAQTTIHCAIDDSVSNHNGSYYA